MKRKFRSFTICTDLKGPVTVDNFYKYSISVYDAKNNLVEIIKKGELSLDLARGLIYGDEKQVKQAIKTIIDNRLYWIARLHLLLHNDSHDICL